MAQGQDVLARAAFMWLRQNGAIGDSIEQQRLALDRSALYPHIQPSIIISCIQAACDTSLSADARLNLIVAVCAGWHPAPDYETPQGQAMREHHELKRAIRERDQYEFTSAATLPQQLYDFLLKCAARSTDDPLHFAQPCSSIMQSPGFGKSRLVCKLARLTKDSDYDKMNVLYMCVRPHGDRRGLSQFPMPTDHLRDYLSPVIPAYSTIDLEGELEAKLMKLYDYASTHWDNVGSEWFAPFDGQSDESIYDNLAGHTVQDPSSVSRVDQEVRVLVLAIDVVRDG